MKNFYDNQLKVSSLLGVLAVLASILTRLEVIVWAIIVILSFIADGGIFSNMQYSVDPFVLLGLLLAAIVIDFIMSLLAVRKRRQFNDSETSYKVYYHNGHTAEWVMTKAI